MTKSLTVSQCNKPVTAQDGTGRAYTTTRKTAPTTASGNRK